MIRLVETIMWRLVAELAALVFDLKCIKESMKEVKRWSRASGTRVSWDPKRDKERGRKNCLFKKQEKGV